ncbi:hypothetical protein GJ496_005800 [Pomphorhynchus laevis]|nr:hypothetical protein GJ496_005800 [Pomphorhynchus laevis]
MLPANNCCYTTCCCNNSPASSSFTACPNSTMSCAMPMVQPNACAMPLLQPNMLNGNGSCGGNIYRQVLYTSEPPPEQICSRRRLPTPPPDVHERIVVVRPPRQLIHEVIEKPLCPPPIIKTDFVLGPRAPPQIKSSKTVSVCPSTNNLKCDKLY